MKETPLVLSVAFLLMALVGSALTEAISLFLRLPKIEILPLAFLGLLLLAVGFTIRYSALRRIFKLNKDFQPKYVPENLIIDGVFRFSRNPAYTGILLMLIGAFLLEVNLLMAVVVIVVFIRLNGMTSHEDEVLLKKFGEAYASYKKKTRKWL